MLRNPSAWSFISAAAMTTTTPRCATRPTSPHPTPATRSTSLVNGAALDVLLATSPAVRRAHRPAHRRARRVQCVRQHHGRPQHHRTRTAPRGARRDRRSAASGSTPAERLGLPATKTTTFVPVMASPRGWPVWRWIAAAAFTALTAVLIGVPTDLIDTPLFTRAIAPTWWSYPVWAVTAVLTGLLGATYLADPEQSPPQPAASRAAPAWVGCSAFSLSAARCATRRFCSRWAAAARCAGSPRPSPSCRWSGWCCWCGPCGPA